MGGFIAGVPIDAATLGYQPTNFSNAVPFINSYLSPGGNLYTVLCGNQATPIVDVWKSTDQGQTWTNLGGGPNFGPQMSFHHGYNGANTITVGLCDGLFPILSSFALQFDLVSETWGAASAVSVNVAIFCVGIRPSGDAILLCQEPTTPLNTIFTTRVFTGGAIGAPLNITTNAFAVMVNPLSPVGGGLGVSMVVDSTGAVHIVFSWLDNLVQVLFYQRVTAGNALGTFFQFPNMVTVIDSSMYLGSPCPLPAVVGTKVIIPIATDTGGGGDPELSLYVGTPLAAPVWTLFPGIDPGIVNPLGPGNFDQPGSNFDGTTLRIAYSPDTQTLRVCETTDFVTWIFTNSTALDIATDLLPAGFAPNTISFPLVNILGSEFAAEDPSHTPGIKQRFFQPFIAAAPPIPPVTNIVLNASSFPVAALPNPSGKCS